MPFLGPTYGMSARLAIYASERGYIYKEGNVFAQATTPDEADEIIELWERLTGRITGENHDTYIDN